MVIAVELRAVLRTLSRSLGFSSVVVLTLAVAIGAATTIFGAIDALLLRPLPLPRAEDLVALRRDGRQVAVRYGEFHSLKQSLGSAKIAAYRFQPATITVGNRSSAAWIDVVTGGYFGLLGEDPVLGRPLTEEDERTKAPVAVVSEDFANAHFGSPSAAIGKTLRLNESFFSIVGVMPKRFSGVYFGRQFHLAVPVSALASNGSEARLPVTLVGRLVDDGARGTQSALALRALNACCRARASGPPSELRHLVVEDPPTGDRSSLYSDGDGLDPITLDPIGRGLNWSVDLRSNSRRTLLPLLAGVLILLLVACGNITVLTLSRIEGRERELAVRLALGATRAHLGRLLVAESALLAGLGALAGLLLGHFSTSLLLRQLGLNVTVGNDSWLPARSMTAFALLLAALSTFLVSIRPIWRAGRSNLVSSMAGSRRRFAGILAPNEFLIVGQVALAIVLMFVSGLMLSTIHNLTEGAAGYRDRNVLLAAVSSQDECNVSRVVSSILRCMHETKYDATRLNVYRDLSATVRSLPGITGVALASNAPLRQDGFYAAPVRVGPASESMDQLGRFSVVSANFFGISGIGLLQGRDFKDSDISGGEAVAIVSESFAERHYPNGTAVGALLYVSDAPIRVVGVARDARYDRTQSLALDLRQTDRDLFFRPLAQIRPVPSQLSLVIRTVGEPRELAPAVHVAASAIASVKVTRLTSVSKVLDDATAQERTAGKLASGFAGVALLLVATGLYAMLVFTVQRRKREIGIRMAVGAQASDAMSLVLRQTMRVLWIGALAGVPLAIAAGFLVRSSLFGVAAADWRLLAGVSVTLLLVALAASVVPGRIATRVDPLVALQSD